MRKRIADFRLQIDGRHKAQGVGLKEESTALFITTPVGASFACDKRICMFRDFGLKKSEIKIPIRKEI